MKRKIAIIGGGMAALAAAFDLTRTKALRDQFDVTIYQLGWRLGGKAASGRRCDGRIVEHGLHIWFGCYENAFELVRAAYAEWHPQEGQAITDPDAAFQAHDCAVIGSGDRGNFFALNCPPMGGLPGVGDARPSLWPCVTQLLVVIRNQYKPNFLPQVPDLIIPPDIVALMAEAGVRVEFSLWNPEQPGTYRQTVEFAKSLSLACEWADRFATEAELRGETPLRGFVRYLRLIARHLLENQKSRCKPIGAFLAELIDVGTALIKGVILDMVLGGASIVELDRLDFRDWLSINDADRDSVYGASVVPSIYNTTMQYYDGDKRRPSFGAGTAAQVSMRLLGTYRGAFAYESRAGLGEVVITPIYRALRQRNVQFCFFHKLTGLELNAARDGIAKIHFDRQVDLCRETYEPTIPPGLQFGNLECWPEAPLWNQIKDGGTLCSLDLESYWCAQKVGEVTLSQGAHFDEAVLAVPVGAFKPLNDEQGPCAELIAASEKFRKLTDSASLVPSICVQAWCTESVEQLGWPPEDLRQACEGAADSPTSTGPCPLNIWGDRTVVLKYENWDCIGHAPASLQYLCDTFETSLYREPPKQVGVQEEADRQAHRLAVHWLESKSSLVWPCASASGGFDWNVLFDPLGREGRHRIHYQVVKAHVDPSACCAGSPAGSTQWRLPADGSGFHHLYLAGAWTDSGFNAECIEAAVMSGKQAARAIARTGSVIAGEDFLHFERGLGAFIMELLGDVVAVAEDVLSFALGGCGAEAPRRAARTRQRRRGQAP
jgi:uncharacterized protein with NAD-binding domain and iron-sulfur cluster